MNKIFFFIALYIFLFNKFLIAQEYIHEGNIELTNQIQVNNFLNTNPKTTVIKGNLFIGDYVSKTSISDLSPLTQLLIVEGVVTIVNTEITTMVGLHKLLEVGTLVIAENDKLGSLLKLEVLEKIYGGLQVDGNDLLTDLIGLEQIIQIGDSIGGGLQVSENINLKTFEGLNNLQTIANNLNISFNDSLISLEALSGLKYIGQSLVVRNNKMLSGFEGLDSLSVVGEGVYIEDNEVLTSFEHIGVFDTVPHHLNIKNNSSLTSAKGLENIEWSGDITITGNNQLSSFIGFDNLAYIDGSLEISNNPEITNLSGFDNLTYIRSTLEIINNENFSSLSGIDKLTHSYGAEFGNNPKLSSCSVGFICDIIENERYLSIYGNKSGCSDKNEVKNNCGITRVSQEQINPIFFYIVNGNINLINKTEKEIYEVELYTLSGMLKYSQLNFNGVSSTTINLGSFSPGIYIVKTRTDKNMYTNKVVYW